MTYKWGSNKYGAKPETVDGIRFDSKAEAEYYRGLRALINKDKITYIECHPTMKLPGDLTYKPDFTVYYPDGTIEVIDVKGMETPSFKIKRKLFDAHHPLAPLKVVRKRGRNWDTI